ncbi:MAG: hypothetical protein ABWK05_01085 [Pyrobaculum sp.]
MKKPLRFFDIAAKKVFTTSDYKVVEITFRYRHGVEKRQMAVATSPYTGNVCYSFAPRRSEVRAVPLTVYF